MDNAEITAALQRAHVARAAYTELLSRSRSTRPGEPGRDDLARLRELNAELYAAEADLARLKRSGRRPIRAICSERTAPPRHTP